VNPPDGREGHVSFLIDQKMVVIGGCNYWNEKCYDDIFVLDLERLNLPWVQMAPYSDNDIPSPREGFAFCNIKDRWFLFQGTYGDKNAKDIFKIQLVN